MYAIYAYIGVVWGVNVGIYGIHGVSGIGSLRVLIFPECIRGNDASRRHVLKTREDRFGGIEV